MRVQEKEPLVLQTRQFLESLNLETIFTRKKRVLIKPNFSGEGGNTDPDVVKGIADAVSHLGLEVVVGESSIIGQDTEVVFDQLRIRDILDVEVIDFKKNPFKKVEISGKAIDYVLVAEEALQCDALISVASLKTLNATTVSLCIKNLKGLLPDTEKLRFHHVGVSQAIVDLYRRFKPDLCVIDAVTGYEMGNPVQVNRLIAGTDAVATDVVGAQMMGFDPFLINAGYPSYSYIGRAVAQKLGDGAPDIVGDFCCIPFNGPPRSLNEIVIPKSIAVVDGSPCSACTGILNLALKRICENHRSPLTICVGPYISHEVPNAVYMGNCLKQFSGIHAEGCPPNSRLDLLPALEHCMKA